MPNGQAHSRADVTAEVPQGPIPGLLLLLFIIDLANVVHANIKSFTDDTSLFSAVDDKTDFFVINNWSCQGKIVFDPDPSKQVLQLNSFMTEVLII